ncbi:MAG: signal peptidase I [Chordicoccus sp.]
MFKKKTKIIRELTPQERRLKQRNRSVFIIETVIVLGIALIAAALFCSSYTVLDSSMSPTLEVGDRVLVNKVSYHFSIHRGDLIAYVSSSSSDSSIHIKRVIGLPGETIQIRDGLILINGETYNEKEEFPAISKAGLAENSITLGSGEYFVLGDNRNNSEDSRFANVGNIKSSQIRGKVWFIAAPAGRIGFAG